MALLGALDDLLGAAAQFFNHFFAHGFTGNRFPRRGLCAGEQGLAFAHGLRLRGKGQSAASRIVAVVLHQDQAGFHTGFGFVEQIEQMPSLRVDTAGPDFVGVDVDHRQVVFIHRFPIGQGQACLAQQPEGEHPFETAHGVHATDFATVGAGFKRPPNHHCGAPAWHRPEPTAQAGVPRCKVVVGHGSCRCR